MNPQPLCLHNTLSRNKERFEPRQPPLVGLYVCGPTVYGEAHLGHARPYLTFDVLVRYLRRQGYRVRYVRNITDVGHLEHDADEGEDKIARKARLEQIEPMEVAERYTRSFHTSMQTLNILPPDIEPRASGHIPEQLQMIEELIKLGFAYESGGSVYFDVAAYSARYPYGQLSGRVTEELLAGAGNERRALEGQSEKRNPADFALWKKAQPAHIMRWSSPWGEGFPGWHIECSAMSRKYLGEPFDIHGGGMDLLFPHHESEIAQSQACCGQVPARIWMHNNMVTIDGQKMGKSLGNFITLNELFAGNHPRLSQAFDPMVIRFFVLQAHYRSTLDFSSEALQAAEKGFKRFMEGLGVLMRLKSDATADDFGVDSFVASLYEALNDDLNTPMLIARIYEFLPQIYSMYEGKTRLSASSLVRLQQEVKELVHDVLGLVATERNTDIHLHGLMDLLLEIRQQAKERRDFASSDAIRKRLESLGIQIKDGKDKSEWSLS
jgi:cysteinyl-tRNA synthetase